MRGSNIIDSFNCAIEGFIYVLKSQRNMKFHFVIAFFVLLFGIYLSLSKIEMLMLLFSILFVLVAEMINTAMELTTDLVTETFHPLVRIVKDIAAGAVLLASINALLVGYLVFSAHLNIPIENGIVKIRQSSWHLTFLSLIVVLFLVVIGKLIFQKGTPLRGGMPSGHAAVSFSIWTITAFISKSMLLTILVLIMAVIIARSRVRGAIHTVWEVVAGSLLGILVTMLIFQLLK